MMAKPGHGERQVIFGATLGDEVEIVVGGDGRFGAASVGRIGVEDVALPVFVEDADAGRFGAGELGQPEVVFDFALKLFRSEGDAVVAVEIVVARGKPLEFSTPP